MGSAYKAVWGCERRVDGEGVDGKGKGERFEDWLAGRWDEAGFVERVAEGYQAERFKMYERGVEALEVVEGDVLRRQLQVDNCVGKAGASCAVGRSVP